MARRPREGPATPSIADRGAREKRDRGAQEKTAFASAVRQLAYRPRTAAELAAHLGARGHAAAVVERTLARLRELGYLDEAAVADVVVRDAERRNLGSRRVAETLARRGVPSDVSAAAARISGAGDLLRARRLLARRYPSGLGNDSRRREGALRLLLRRGFPCEIARQAVGLDRDVER